jgi:xanthosine utilization system XapX-like protein
MKKLIYVLGALALVLVVFNLFQIDYADPFTGDSLIAIIGVVAGLCAVLLLVILLLAKKIQQRMRG